jgi:putative ATPase
VVHLACAPKSNRVTVALGRAQQDVRQGPRGDVPAHLRDSHYQSAGSIGHGQGYVYPHDEPGAWTDQQYRPPELGKARYYEPSDRGHEAVVAERLRKWRGEGDGAAGSGGAGGSDGGVGAGDGAGGAGDEVDVEADD